MAKTTFQLLLTLLTSAALSGALPAQSTFSFGADLSYVNEMEDCGAVYKENGQPKDPYQIFADHHCNLVRLRLWHTPAWYDTLNNGQRYADLADVRQSIQRAKAAGMRVLLDFHLSDTWADPSHQRAPAAWLGVVDNLPLLKDSLYNYISATLLSLHSEGLLPDIVQIGNETNKGILLSPAADAVWTLDWNRNSQLFNRAIQAVRDVENSTGQPIEVALHIAGPADAGWLMQGFWSHGVTDFDVIGLSYYWAWHQPTSIADAGNVVAQLRQTYPGKKVMVFETGYIWTTANNDNANNILNVVNASYAPASPAQQRQWLIDLTQEVIDKGGSGVIYWEPAWVSTSCWTPWGQGSHGENAAFFDFDNNLLPDGGLFFMSHEYSGLSPAAEPARPARRFEVWPDSGRRALQLRFEGYPDEALRIELLSADNRLILSREATPAETVSIALPELAPGIYYVVARGKSGAAGMRGVFLGGK